MQTPEGLPGNNELLRALQSELDFVPDGSGEWLINKERSSAGGFEYGEELEAVLRLSADGIYQQGVHIDDLQGILELNRLNSDRVQDITTLMNFWPEETGITSHIEGDYHYFGIQLADVSKTGFESSIVGSTGYGTSQ